MIVNLYKYAQDKILIIIIYCFQMMDLQINSSLQQRPQKNYQQVLKELVDLRRQHQKLNLKYLKLKDKYQEDYDEQELQYLSSIHQKEQPNDQKAKNTKRQKQIIKRVQTQIQKEDFNKSYLSDNLSDKFSYQQKQQNTNNNEIRANQIQTMNGIGQKKREQKIFNQGGSFYYQDFLILQKKKQQNLNKNKMVQESISAPLLLQTEKKKMTSQMEKKPETGQEQSFDLENSQNISASRIDMTSFSSNPPPQIYNQIPAQMNENLQNEQIIVQFNPPSQNEPIQLNEDFGNEQESDQQQSIQLRNLLNKLTLKNKMTLKQIKKIIKQTQKLAQDNPQLIQIQASGTYQLQLAGSHVQIDEKYIKKILSWNRLLITQMFIGSDQNFSELQLFFKAIEWPCLRQITFEKKNLQLLNKEGKLQKIPQQQDNIGYLKYFGLSKKIKVLQIRGETFSKKLSKSLVDLNFPRLKTLYLGFQNKWANQCVEIFLSKKLQNFSKAQIVIANWGGSIDERFGKFYGKVQFIRLDSDDSE